MANTAPPAATPIIAPVDNLSTSVNLVVPEVDKNSTLEDKIG